MEKLICRDDRLQSLKKRYKQKSHDPGLFFAENRGIDIYQKSYDLFRLVSD